MQRHSEARKFMSMKNSSETIGTSQLTDLIHVLFFTPTKDCHPPPTHPNKILHSLGSHPEFFNGGRRGGGFDPETIHILYLIKNYVVKIMS